MTLWRKHAKILNTQKEGPAFAVRQWCKEKQPFQIKMGDKQNVSVIVRELSFTSYISLSMMMTGDGFRYNNKRIKIVKSGLFQDKCHLTSLLSHYVSSGSMISAGGHASHHIH